MAKKKSAAPESMDDAIARLGEVAHRQDSEAKAEHALSVAKTRLVLDNNADSVFFATCVMRLRFKPDWNIGTAATDGRSLLYDPDFIIGLDDLELRAVLAHEVLHCVNKHFTRRGGRHPVAFNIAADCAINPILQDAGFTLPKDCLFPGKAPFADLVPGMCAEEYYSRLNITERKLGGNEQDPGGCGGVFDPSDGESMSECEAKSLEAEWNANVAAARQAAQRRGTMSAGLDRICGAALEPVIDWKSVLRNFLTQQAKVDYTWKKPNRRWVHAGIYLPSRSSQVIGHITILADMSGSISDELVTRFCSEITDIARQGVTKITTIYHDAEVCKIDEWLPEHGDYTMTACGGGGTSHIPAFEYVDGLEEPPVVCISFTDMYSEFPKAAPAYPVLFAVAGNLSATAPFGTVVHIKDE